ncbi:hypothetical protein ACFOWM_02205 [Ferruginibacter yonginensis]|uniref:Tetratricopeptide repeat protein n=1 Tax=Ferruginibacter yonginensis TaxID=1310416 RepID=A0ABV8QRM2_9BACT
MKKIVLIICAVTTSIFANAQSEMEKKITTSTCNCIGSKPITEKFMEETFGECMGNAFGELEADLEVEATARGLQTEEQMEEFGRELGSNVTLQLISECDLFYKEMAKLRAASVADLKDDSAMIIIADMNKTPEAKRNDLFYCKRGAQYFYNGDFKNAAADFHKVNFIPAEQKTFLVLRAQSYEFNKEYPLAITTYEDLIKQSGSSEFKIILALLKKQASIK